jgi:hypothetical protein
MLNVFVSSTYEDLKEHRRQVRALIEALGLNDIAMEKWPASPRPPCREVEEALRASNIYLGIIGWRRGSLIPDLQKSYVRFEYELARSIPLPMLVFLKDPAASTLNEIDRGPAWEEILKFREEVEREQAFVRVYFADPLDLILRVSASLFRLLAGTNEFKALSSEDQFILELRQIMQADFLARLSQIKEAQMRGSPPEDKGQWFFPSLGRCNMGDWYIPREEVSRRVADWLVTGKTPYLFLVGPSGIGKTNFLLDFILRAHSEQRTLKRHALLMLPLGSYVPEQSFIENLQAFVNRSRRLRVPVDTAVLKNLIADGRLILVLDGLDEFARQQGEVACEHLFAALKDEVGPPHVIVSCRDHILRRLRGGALLRDLAINEVQVPPLVQREVLGALERRMGRGSVPFRAASLHPGLLRFAENPLLFEMMCEMSDRSWRRLIETQLMGKVYDLWFEEALEAGAGGESVLHDGEIQDARLKIGRIARIMLEKRSDLISRTQLDEQHLPPRCLRTPGQPFGILIQETRDDWGFVHDSLRDFALAKSVTTELASKRYELLARTTHLDYVGGEMYRFLRDLLETDLEAFARYFDDALASRPETSEAWNSIVWNCFEAAGMIATADTARRFIDKALGILSSAKAADGHHRALSGEAEYNIVRCLERLHASAPKPYCDYMMSRKRPSDPEWYIFGAWAVRGFQRSERHIDPYPPMTYRWERNQGTDHRQEEVSACLLDLIEDTLDQARDKWAPFVVTNCTFALIRWLHPGHVTRLKDLLSKGQLGPEARANLFLALTRFRNPCLFEGTSDLFAGMVLSFSYLSRDMIPPKDFIFRRVEFRHKHSRFVEIDPYDTGLFEDCRFPF